MARSVRRIFLFLGPMLLLAAPLAGFAFQSFTPPPPQSRGALDYEQRQVHSVMSAHGYFAIAAMSKDGNGYWRAEGRKDERQWDLRVSPRGALSARPVQLLSAEPESQLHIQLQ